MHSLREECQFMKDTISEAEKNFEFMKRLISETEKNFEFVKGWLAETLKEWYHMCKGVVAHEAYKRSLFTKVAPLL